MTSLLLDLEIDALSWEFLANRIVQMGGARPPQPIVEVLDSPRPDQDVWDATYEQAIERAPGETCMEQAERLMGRMGL